MTSPRHWILPVLATLSIPITSVVLAPDLPSPVARHFGPDAVADGAASLLATTVLLAVVTGGVALGSLAAVRTVPTRASARTLVATAHLVAVALATLHWRILDLQRGLADWTQATMSIGPTLALVLVPGALAAAVGWWLAGDIEVDERDRTERPPDLEVEPGEAVVWSGRSGATWPAALGALLLVVAAGTHVLAGNAWVTGLLVVVALVVASMLSVRVTVGPAGLVVRGGVVAGFPRTTVPLDEIDDVRVEDVELLSYGGLGYRVAPGVRAIVPLPGAGLRVVRDHDHDVVVTVPGASEAASVLAAHLRQSGAARSHGEESR